MEWNFGIVRWSWSGVEMTRSGVGVELELMPFFQLRFNSCRFYDLPEENGKKSTIKIDVHAHDIYDAINRPMNE